jgi:hypothetical protein
VATWNLEYRRAGNPGGGWPGSFFDLAAGTDFLRTIAQPNQLDLHRLVLVGLVNIITDLYAAPDPRYTTGFEKSTIVAAGCGCGSPGRFIIRQATGNVLVVIRGAGDLAEFEVFGQKCVLDTWAAKHAFKALGLGTRRHGSTLLDFISDHTPNTSGAPQGELSRDLQISSNFAPSTANSVAQALVSTFHCVHLKCRSNVILDEEVGADEIVIWVGPKVRKE